MLENEGSSTGVLPVWQGSCYLSFATGENIMKKIKYLAALLIGIAGLGLQQTQATIYDFQNSMHWSTNDTYLVGTVIPGTLGGAD